VTDSSKEVPLIVSSSAPSPSTRSSSSSQSSESSTSLQNIQQHSATSTSALPHLILLPSSAADGKEWRDALMRVAWNQQQVGQLFHPSLNYSNNAFGVNAIFFHYLFTSTVFRFSKYKFFYTSTQMMQMSGHLYFRVEGMKEYQKRFVKLIDRSFYFYPVSQACVLLNRYICTHWHCTKLNLKSTNFLCK
jgi:hypothetical protein